MEAPVRNGSRELDGRPTFASYFMSMAELASTRSTCVRRQVGAVITVEDRVIATGYNGAPASLQHCSEGACPRGLSSKVDVPPGSQYNEGAGRCIALHAEQNAINSAHQLYGDLATGLLARSAMWVNSESCMHVCLPMIIAADVSELYELVDGDIRRTVPRKI